MALKPMSGVEQERLGEPSKDFEGDSKKIEGGSQKSFGSNTTRIENQVRLKAQL